MIRNAGATARGEGVDNVFRVKLADPDARDKTKMVTLGPGQTWTDRWWEYFTKKGWYRRCATGVPTLADIGAVLARGDTACVRTHVVLAVRG